MARVINEAYRARGSSQRRPVEHRAHVGMLGPQRLLADRKAALLQGFSFGIADPEDVPPRRVTLRCLTQPQRRADELRGLSNSLQVLRRSEEHTSELQSLRHLVCRLLL